MSEPMDDLRDVSKLLALTMTEGISLLSDLREAEARWERAKSEALAAEERVTLLRHRYADSRKLAMNMWETVRDELVPRVPVTDEPAATALRGAR